MSFEYVNTPLNSAPSSVEQRRAAVLSVLRLGERHDDPEGAMLMLAACGLLDDAVDMRAETKRRPA